MSAADAVDASIEQMHSLGDKIKKQRAETTASLAEVRKQNAASTKKELDEAQAKKRAGKGGTPDGRERRTPVPARSTVVNEMSFGNEDDAAPAASAPAPVHPPEPPPQPTPPQAPVRHRADSIRFGYEDDEYADTAEQAPTPPPSAPDPAPSRSSGWSSSRSSRPARGDDDDDYSEQSWLR